MEGTVLKDAAWGTEHVEGKRDNGKEFESFEAKLRWGVKQHGVENCDIWDLASGQVTKTLEGHEAAVNCVTFSPDGSQLASCSGNLRSSDNSIKVFQLLSSVLECISLF